MGLFKILDINENIETEGITEEEAMELISSNDVGQPNQYYYYPIEENGIEKLRNQFLNDTKQVKLLKRQD
jgi:hypothetical protein